MVCSLDAVEELSLSSHTGCQVNELLVPTTPLLYWCPTLDKSRELARCLLRTSTHGPRAKQILLWMTVLPVSESRHRQCLGGNLTFAQWPLLDKNRNTP